MKKQLFEITMTAYKSFYVEAKSQQEALQSIRVEEESSFRWTDVDWELEDVSAKPLTSEFSRSIRANHSDQILKDL